MIALVVVLGAAIGFRVYLISAADFPLNDGALFYEFVRALAVTFPELPEHVPYNGLAIPFAYPPLSFWFGAALTKAGADPLEVVRLVPLLVNSLYLALFAILLLHTERSRLFAAIALLFLCTRLGSFQWLIMGGGLSRGFGSIFFLLTLLAVLPAFASRRTDVPWRAMILTGLAVGGAILSHLEWGIDAAASVVLATALGSRSIAVFVKSCVAAGAVAAAVIAPWLLAVTGAHGVEPFLAASGSSNWEIDPIVALIAFVARSALLNPLIILGAAFLIWRRRYFWPALVMLAVVVTPRHAATVISLPLSVLSAAGAFGVFVTLRSALPARRIALAATAVAVLFFAGIRVARDMQTYGDTLRTLSSPQRSAMAWVSARTPGSRYAVVTRPAWYADHVAEWFPTIANARSVTTVQGSEWLPGGAFQNLVLKSEKMKAAVGCRALMSGMEAFGPADYVWSEVQPACFRQAGLRPLYRNAQVIIFARNDVAAPAPKTPQ